MKFRRLVSCALALSLILGVGVISARGQDIIEWLGHETFRTLNPQLRYAGALTLTNKAGTASLGFDTNKNIVDANGNAALNIAATVGAVNNLQVVNSATGTAPSIVATGTDTNIGITLTPKGTGVVNLNGPVTVTSLADTNGIAALTIGTTASAVNNIKVTDAATGANPIISSVGTDANIGVTITPKGTGSVVLNGPVRAGGTTSVGFDGSSNITDNNNLAVINLGSTTSAVNNLKTTNAAAGNSPDVAVIGSDTNISGTLTPKGTGIWTFGSSGTATATAGAATLNTQLGVVTSEALTTAAGATYTLTLTNTKIATTSRLFVSTGYGTSTTGSPAVMRVQPAAGSATIVIQNIHATVALNGTITIAFLVL